MKKDKAFLAVGKRVQAYAKNAPMVNVSIEVYGQGQLTSEEANKLLEILVDETMLVIDHAPYTKTPLHKMSVKKVKL